MNKGMVASFAVLAMLSGALVSAHHSFAMYDQNKVVTMTGAMKQYVPQANHAELHFYALAPDYKSLAKSADGKTVEWGVEMGGTAQMERQGINSQTFAAGTVFSVRMNPLRDGSNFGARTGSIAKCPTDPATKKPVFPEPGKHCDSVKGHTIIGGTTF